MAIPQFLEITGFQASAGRMQDIEPATAKREPILVDGSKPYEFSGLPLHYKIFTY